MDGAGFDTFLAQVVEWCRRQPAIDALTLVGSHVRGQARPDSDIDLLLLTTDPRTLLDDPTWPAVFGAVERTTTETWGDVDSLRVWYRGGSEVEFGITTPAWARIPLDPGKQQVVAGGFRILLDRSGNLARLRPGPEGGPELRHGAKPAGMC